MITYNILSTGSKGNAVIIHDFVLVDCGVPYRMIQPYIGELKLILLTHIHSDHFRPSTIRRISAERPTVRFGCGRWLAPELVKAGVPASNIDILEPNVLYGYGLLNVIPVPLVHNVPNQGYKLHFRDGKVFYATDTNNLNGIRAHHYDLYLVEANYEDDVILQKIAEKKAAGEYAYEVQVLHNHLSKTKCDDWLYANMAPSSTYVYLHCHEDKPENPHIKNSEGGTEDDYGYHTQA